MNEPTVLDYLKSIFKNWDSFKKFLLALSERKDTTLLMEESSTLDVVPAAYDDKPVAAPRKFPWLTLLVLVLALIAQQTFEPPQQFYIVGIVLYIAALGIALLAFRRGEWTLTPLPADEVHTDAFAVRGFAFGMSLLFSAMAFYFFKGNLFKIFNLILWAGAIFFHLRAFWVSEPRTSVSPSIVRRVIDFFTRPEWNIRVTRWGLVVLFIMVATVFFRTYRLDSVPNEMTSDHAEKLMDVYDITQGQYSIYFPRNTGREPLYIYLCAFVAQWFGVSFITLKIVAVAGGLLTLPFMYLLGKELGGARIGLLAVAFAGIGYWPSVIERFGLRISFYPLFAAATLYYFFRGMRRQNRNDFILAGVALGVGLNGYTPFRIMPFVLVAMFVLYFLHLRDAQSRKQALVWFGLLAFTSWVFVIPMARFAVERPDIFVERAFSRVGTLEREFPAPVWQLVLINLWTALKEFNWYNGNIWVHSVPGRPALEVVSGALFLIGVSLVLVRYIRERHWKDLLLLLAVPLLQMPSILSLAFPEENPSLNRTGAALVPVFLLVGFGLDSLLNGFVGNSGAGDKSNENREVTTIVKPSRAFFAGTLLSILFLVSFSRNYDLIFNKYYEQYRMGAWNSAEMGAVMRGFIDKGGSIDQVWIVPYAFWVDTRLPPFWAGEPGRDIAIAPDNLASTLELSGDKLFMFSLQDAATLQTLKLLYPNGKLTVLQSSLDFHNFYIYRVPAAQ